MLFYRVPATEWPSGKAGEQRGPWAAMLALCILSVDRQARLRFRVLVDLREL